MGLGVLLLACSDSETAELPQAAASSGAPAAGGGGATAAGTRASAGADLEALRANGIDKYIGAVEPSSQETGENGEVVFRFDVQAGPRCLRGDPYAMSIRKQDSDDLVIYLQGGGSCSSAVCSANTTADPKIPAVGLFNSSDSQNPVASWNLVYVPYCDGSLHYGDADHADESPPRYHHGLRNLSAALDVAVASFPKPRRILLTGSSAGALGTIYASPLVRLLYPQAELFVWNDSGSGISKPDGSRTKITRAEWATGALLPPSCDACPASPHSTPVIAWNLGHDPGLKVSFFSAYEDSVLADTFLMIGGPAFKQALLDETGKVQSAHPSRVKRFYVGGTLHTTAANLSTALGSVTIGQWLGYMLAGDARWVDSLQ